MKTAFDLFTSEIHALIKEYNVYAKINSFLYKNEDVQQHMMNVDGWGDRFDFVHKCNNIERKLTPLIHNVLHGKRVRVMGGHPTKLYEGIIEHYLKRTYEGRELDNETAFRYRNGEEDVNIMTSSQCIDLWVNTGDKHSTHLYPADKIELIEEEGA
jgi:hypothetical protein